MIRKSRISGEYAIGILFLIIVATIWSASSILVQYIFHDLQFQHPFFLTYIGISLFSINLPCYYLSQILYPQCMHLSRVESPSYRNIIRISAIVSPLWFAANFSYNLSLNSTSVTSSTIISSTSSIFTLLSSHFVLDERLTYMKFLGVALCMAGNTATVFHDSDQVFQDSVFGDMTALFAALMYGFYTTAIRKLIPDDTRISIALFFGFLGVINCVCLFPVVIYLHLSGVELLGEITMRIMGLLCLKGLLDNVISDYLWARAVLLTSPTVATVGLSLTVPLAIVSDLVIHWIAPGFTTVLAAILVIAGFVCINIGTQDQIEYLAVEMLLRALAFGVKFLCFVRASKVITLNDKNFEHLTQASSGMTTGDWLIEFHAPWCTHCKQFAPVFDSVAEELDSLINVAAIDGTENAELISRFKIDGYPKLLFLRHGHMYLFNGIRSKEALVEFAQEGYKRTEQHPIPLPKSLTRAIFSQIQQLQQQVEDMLITNQSVVLTIFSVGLFAGLLLGGTCGCLRYRQKEKIA